MKWKILSVLGALAIGWGAIGLYGIVRDMIDQRPIGWIGVVAVSLAFTGCLIGCMRDVTRWWRHE